MFEHEWTTYLGTLENCTYVSLDRCGEMRLLGDANVERTTQTLSPTAGSSLTAFWGTSHLEGERNQGDRYTNSSKNEFSGLTVMCWRSCSLIDKMKSTDVLYRW